MGEGNYALASHRIEETDLLFSHLDQVQIGYLCLFNGFREDLYVYYH